MEMRRICPPPRGKKNPNFSCAAGNDHSDFIVASLTRPRNFLFDGLSLNALLPGMFGG